MADSAVQEIENGGISSRSRTPFCDTGMSVWSSDTGLVSEVLRLLTRWHDGLAKPSAHVSHMLFRKDS
ncbi:hypothetical protein [Mycolicibacterium palauense]|uniref:hypothetical protein n=1 Tax=Mycolicibacterium palauense TaxID=2034511 RepID=UPI001145E9D2|nr:hypothetical protein [Mycolicibacterium palauense]